MSCIDPYHHAQFMGYDQHLTTFRAGSRSRVSMTQHRILHLWYTYGTNLRVAQFSRLRTVLLLVDDHCLSSVSSRKEDTNSPITTETSRHIPELQLMSCKYL